MTSADWLVVNPMGSIPEEINVELRNTGIGDTEAIKLIW